MRKIAVKLGAIIIVAASPALYGDSPYAVTRITLPNEPGLIPQSAAINNSGTVAVWGGVPGGSSPQRAFVWQAGIAEEIPTPSSERSQVNSINNAGAVVGLTYDALGVPHGFIWDANQSVFSPTFPGMDSSYFRAVNNQSEVVGYAANTILGTAHAFVWDRANGVTILPSIGTGIADADSINDLGQIVGSSGNSFDTAYPVDPNSSIGFEHAVLWDHGAIIDLTPGTAWSGANGINNQGQVVGYRMRTVPNGDGIAPNFFSTPFLWDSVHGSVDLPMQGEQSNALAINDAGQIVGFSGSGDSDVHALFWQDGLVYDLNDLISPDSGWVLQYATNINDLGQIVGTGTYDGQDAAFLLTPDAPPTIPEPALIWIAGCALPFFQRRR